MDLSPLQKACKKLYDIDVDYFESITRDCETLPKVMYPGANEERELAIDYRDHVVAAFKKDIAEILSGATFDRTEANAVFHKIAKIKDPQISDDTLRDLYENARRRTILERITTNNKSDIIAFHHALMDVTVWECREELEQKILTTNLKMA